MVSLIEYVSIASPITMTELDEVDLSTGCVLSAAIRFGVNSDSYVRLIDNILVGGARREILGEI